MRDFYYIGVESLSKVYLKLVKQPTVEIINKPPTPSTSAIDSDCSSYLDELFEDDELKKLVVLGEPVSEWKSVLSGVPQGSVLGPLLFVIFINDLSVNLNNTGKLFEDDTKVISMVKSQEDIINLQNDMN